MPSGPLQVSLANLNFRIEHFTQSMGIDCSHSAEVGVLHIVFVSLQLHGIKLIKALIKQMYFSVEHVFNP